MNQTVIAFKDASFSYNNTPIIQNVSFTISSGEFIGIIGPNGGGKTTLLKIILGFLTPTQGKVTVFGKAPEDVVSRIAYVPQSTQVDKQFPLSVLELVLMGRLSHLPWYGRFKEEDKKKAMEALERVGIADLSQRAFGTLSSGQAQRALIARALASEPDLLLLDEPTASVDNASEASIHEILLSLRSIITVLMVTHDLHAIINDVEKVLTVHMQVKLLEREEVCKHFAYGLYHPPLMTPS